MSTNQLRIRFKLSLKRWDLDHLTQKWVLFHRWLPNGRDDAIEQTFPDENVKISFWFERHGYVKDKMIQFELDRNEIPDEVMDRQAVLESGPLYGCVTIDDVSETVIGAIVAQKRGDTDYVAFAKRVIKKYLQPELSRVVQIVRYYFGQYWIRNFETWDSGQVSLGRYCQRLGLEVSVDGGRNWLEFVPDEPTSAPIEVTLDFVHPRLLMSQDDWGRLRKSFSDIPTPSLALQVLNYGHEILDQGNTRHALVEIITALELTVNEFMRRTIDGADAITNAVQSFYDRPLKEKVVTLCIASGTDRQDLEHTLQAIQARHDLVHEAKQPQSNCKSWLRATLRICASLSEGPAFKFPPDNTGNRLVGDPAQWAKLYERREY